MLAVRQSSKAFGRGELLFLKPGNRKVLAYLRTYGEEVILCVVNLARSAQPVELDLAAFKGRVPVELLGRTSFPPIGELPYQLTIAAHGFYWFKLSTDASVPTWHQEFTAAEERPVIVLFDGWNSLFRDHVVPWRIGMAVKTRAQFETDILPRHIESQRWYAAKGTTIKRAQLLDHALWEQGPDAWLLPLLELEGPANSLYFVPLALTWEDKDEERFRAFSTATVARVRQQADVGLMADAFADERFCRAVIDAIGKGRELRAGVGTIRFKPTNAFARIAGPDIATLPVSRPQAQSSNTIVTIAERLFLKGYRRLGSDVNPEFEVGSFLTEVARFAHCAPVAGAVEYIGADGVARTLCLLQAHVSNQGDGWVYMLGYLQRYFEQLRSTAEPLPADVHGAHLALTETLGKRTAQLHLALATPSAVAAFKPEPLTATDIAGYRDQALIEARETLDALEVAAKQYTGATLDDARAVLAGRAALLERIEQFSGEAPAMLKTRVHGDYHLAQVLLTRNDFVIVDFEGEPARTFAERRAKQSPLRDVAGMLRSFSYARASALRNGARTADEQAQLEGPATAWELDTRAAFLSGYAKAVKGSALYERFDPKQSLLPLFELHKAFYELRYELNNRPDWVRIPLAGIRGFIART
jgi:maltose alpha-D-glucosyltransferase/alpha-amylase